MASDDVEVVVFHNRPKSKNNLTKVKKTKNSIANESKKETREKSKELLLKIKNDVEKFGISGYDKEEQRRRMRQKAIKLGAIPEKQKPINYRIYLESQLNSAKKKTTTNSKKNSDVRKKLDIKPGVGKYKNGILRLSKQDVANLKK